MTAIKKQSQNAIKRYLLFLYYLKKLFLHLFLVCLLPQCLTTPKLYKNVNHSNLFFVFPLLTESVLQQSYTKKNVLNHSPPFFSSLFQMTWLKMRTRPCETEFQTWKKGSMTKMMKLPVYALRWPMRYDASIPLNQQKVRYLKRGHQ